MAKSQIYKSIINTFSTADGIETFRYLVETYYLGRERSFDPDVVVRNQGKMDVIDDLMAIMAADPKRYGELMAKVFTPEIKREDVE